MQKLLFLLFILFSIKVSYPQVVQHSLDGVEDQNGITQLILRVGDKFYPNNQIFSVNAENGEVGFLMNAFDTLGISRGINDFEFFSNNTTNFLNCGEVVYPDNHGLISLNETIFVEMMFPIHSIGISRQNPNLAFAGDGYLWRSFDGGLTWPLDSMRNFNFCSVYPFNDNIIFGITYDNRLIKSTDVGLTSELVDTIDVFWDNYFQFLYDVNQAHVYRINRSLGRYTLNVSDNKGNAFSWTKTYQSEIPFFITIDSLNSGLVYLADGRRIYKSTDNGYSFTLYRNLSSRIVGIYKKPGAEILYAATRKKLYKITPDSSFVIKSLPVPPDILEYYPLTIGNKWIYNSTTIEYNPYPSGSFTIVKREVLGDSIAPNGKKYFVIEDQTNWNFLVLERIDSAEAKVYRYADFPGFPDDEFIVDDLWAEVGDTLESYRMGYWGDGYTTVLGVDTFNQWGMIKPKKIFEQYILHPPIYSLTQGIGLDSIYFYFDFGETYITLKGCVLNGVVFGDTSMVVSVDDDKDVTPSEFILHQNYPNPFNPNTVISYQLPVAGDVTLRIYDVLGREVVTLIDEYRDAGYHEVEFQSAVGNGQLASGVYYYQLTAGSFIETKKMMVMK